MGRPAEGERPLTERLYLLDSYQKTFHAQVIQQRTFAQGPAVVLDKTCFYPTSGGQMHDRGFLNGIAVQEVQMLENEIWHFLAAPLAAEEVFGEIDWDRRFDFMQQHTAFHILAGCFAKQLQEETLASHLGEEESTIEVAIKAITQEEIDEVEAAANRVVWQNRSVTITFVTAAEAKTQPLRKASDLAGPIRLVDIHDLDLDPCGGTHVSSTGQVGLIKIVHRERIRGHWRFAFVAGRRALREMRKQQAVLSQINERFAIGADQIIEQLDKWSTENKKLRKSVQKLGSSLAEQSLMVLCQHAREHRLASHVFEQMAMEDLRRLASTAIKQQPGTYLLAAVGDEVFLVFSSSDDHLDLRSILTTVLPIIDGKGGGEARFVQAGGRNVTKVAEALQIAEKMVRLQWSNESV